MAFIFPHAAAGAGTVALCAPYSVPCQKPDVICHIYSADPWVRGCLEGSQLHRASHVWELSRDRILKVFRGIFNFPGCAISAEWQYFIVAYIKGDLACQLGRGQWAGYYFLLLSSSITLLINIVFNGVIEPWNWYGFPPVIPSTTYPY